MSSRKKLKLSIMELEKRENRRACTAVGQKTLKLLSGRVHFGDKKQIGFWKSVFKDHQSF
jgi:16S rRNA U516 pseudouridylate synthase RsuA-like enzyme